MKKLLILLLLLCVQPALANGGFEDSLADVMTWVVLIVMPIGFLYLFWIAHIYPEKVAEKNNHPQLKAIKVMCLLSLFVGGLLWPIALIWASYNYDKPDDEDNPETALANKDAMAPEDVKDPSPQEVESSTQNKV